ncbi:hypothetical protein GOB94_04020 [Granulicella sp. 5B5]|uniref:hypothetical protein n=1 Tax=Granulicella sp. 5B5 TaxID=1617967 RepID=UPI0015F5AB8A|nr:hypothetical protein [Granulicella sp. 5B5]QMV17950.1 hypothetical protein GOB94_04020 [Granulicella sp. 5B5]
MTTVPTCNHIFADNHRCGSPALRGERFCYFHHPDRRPVANPYERRSRRGFTITVPHDAESLQRALAEVMQRLAANTIDVHRASLLLYSLQLAARRLPAHTPYPETRGRGLPV